MGPSCQHYELEAHTYSVNQAHPNKSRNLNRRKNAFKLEIPSNSFDKEMHDTDPSMYQLEILIITKGIRRIDLE
jgi:hypothetical protein